MKPDKFNGNGSVETFLAQFDICAEYNEWSDNDKAAHLKCCLVGAADQLIWDSGRAGVLSYGELRDKLRRRFGSQDQQEKFQAELRARRRRRGETLAELYQDVRRLMTLAYPGEGTSSLCEQIAKDHFIAALGDRDLELKIREREPRDLESAFKHAVRLEAYDKAVDDRSDQQRFRSGRNRHEDGLARKVMQLEQKIEEAGNRKSAVRESAVVDQSVQELRREMARLTKQNEDLSKEVGRLHLLEEQRAKASKPAEPSETPAATRSLKCYYCGEPGHFARECKQKAQRTKEEADKVAGTNSGEYSSRLRSQTYLKLLVNGRWRKCLLDTGSHVTLLPPSVVAGIQLETTSRSITAANGTAIKVLGMATVTASAGQHQMSISGLVSPHVGEIMLGIGFMKDHEAMWNFRVAEIVLDGQRSKLCSRDRQPWCRRIILQEEVEIPAGSELDLSTLAQYGDFSVQTDSKSSWATEAREIAPGVRVSHCAQHK